MKAEIVYFPKKCEHGIPVSWFQHFSTLSWYSTPIDCKPCMAFLNDWVEAIEENWDRRAGIGPHWPPLSGDF